MTELRSEFLPARLIAVALLFAVLQLLLVASAADRIAEPDLAEVGLMALGDGALAGEPWSRQEVLRVTRAGPNAPHGGFLPVSLLYALGVSVVGTSSYTVLKLISVGFATFGFLAWLAVARGLGGRRAATCAALLLFFAPPSSISGRLIAWGSHPESAALLGGVAWLALVRAGPRAWWIGLVLGGAVGFSRGLLAAVAVLAVAWTVRTRPRPHHLAAMIGCAMVVFLGWMGLCDGWSASVTETPGNTPGGLLAGAGSGVLETLSHTLPLRIAPPAFGSFAPIIDLLGGITLAAAMVWTAMRRETRALPLLVIAHLALVVFLAPQRPNVPVRYLLPLWPVCAVMLAVTASELTGRRALVAATLLLWACGGAWVTMDLIDPGRAPVLLQYRPQDYVAQDIGKVTYATAPGVNDFLTRRTSADGFRDVVGSGAGRDLLMRPPPHPVDPREVRERAARLNTPRALENLGWGLAVFASDRPGARASVLTGMTANRREAVARGYGMGLRANGQRPSFFGRDPDEPAIRAGMEWLEAEAAAGRTPPLP